MAEASLTKKLKQVIETEIARLGDLAPPGLVVFNEKGRLLHGAGPAQKDLAVMSSDIMQEVGERFNHGNGARYYGGCTMNVGGTAYLYLNMAPARRDTKDNGLRELSLIFYHEIGHIVTACGSAAVPGPLRESVAQAYAHMRMVQDDPANISMVRRAIDEMVILAVEGYGYPEKELAEYHTLGVLECVYWEGVDGRLHELTAAETVEIADMMALSYTESPATLRAIYDATAGMRALLKGCADFNRNPDFHGRFLQARDILDRHEDMAVRNVVYKYILSFRDVLEAGRKKKTKEGAFCREALDYIDNMPPPPCVLDRFGARIRTFEEYLAEYAA